MSRLPRFATIFLALLALLLPAAAAEGPKNSIILIIRHAEKPEDGLGLAKEGEHRAKAYTRYFRPYTMEGQPLHLDALYASADTEESQRPRLTLRPLSKTLNLPLSVRYNHKDTEELCDALRKDQAGKHVLICWHHGEIPNLLDDLGVDAKLLLPDGKWPGSVYDWVLQLAFDQDGKLVPERSKRINQQLMPGDSK